METKTLDLTKTVYELCETYPELRKLLVSLGFKPLANPLMYKMMAKKVTIPEAGAKLDIKMNTIVDALTAAGFTLSDGSENAKEREELLKSYLRRVSDGEDMEAVKKDFKANFQEVKASEIMAAEQSMIEEGTPIKDVQKLCDLHSALFHGTTEQEKIQAADASLKDSLARERDAKFLKLVQIPGHPLRTFTEENRALEKILDAFEHAENLEKKEEIFASLYSVVVHYAKKGDMLYPLLAERYNIIGPSQVMWGVDDEIRDEWKKLRKEGLEGKEERINKLITRMKEMIYKEDNILYPLCAAHFSEQEWKDIENDSHQYPVCFGIKPENFQKEEKLQALNDDAEIMDGMVKLPTGTFTLRQLRAVLNAINVELSFVDESDINRYYNEGHKAFRRPLASLGREVYTCHPPMVEKIVRGIIADFKAGKKDKVEVWMSKENKTYLVTYLALRDSKGYVGTLEAVYPMEEAKNHFLNK